MDSLTRRYPRRPPRLDRLFHNTHPFYFVTFNTHRRIPLLASPEVHTAFLDFVIHAQDRGISVGRYVIMPDHIHLFVVIPPVGITVSGWIQALKSVLGKKLIELGHDKPHWQRGFFDHVMRSSDSYSQKWDYVRLNPVRAGLCDIPEEWPYQGEIVPIRF
jgi:REP element-mobilizing transposase RayT